MRYLSIVMVFFAMACASSEEGTTEVTEEVKDAIETNEVKTDFTDFDVAKAKSWISETADKIILDVRTDGEVAGGMIDGAIQIDFSKPEFEDELNKLDKSKPVLVYCAAGGRSGQTLEKMKTMGFNEAHNLLGGYTAWSSEQ